MTTVARPVPRTFAWPSRWPLLAGGAAALLYLVTLSGSPSSDSMAFARLTRESDLGAPLFFQAEHLLYPFVGWLAALVLRFGDWPLTALQVVNALAGGIAVGAAGVAAGSILSRPAALAVTAALAVASGWWYHATGAEDQILANAAMLVAVAALLGDGSLAGRWLPTGRGWVVVAGVAIGVLVHATTVLVLPAAIVLAGNRPRRDLVVCAGWLALLVGVPYLVLGGIVHGYRDFASWRGWLLAAPGQGVWGRLSPRNLLVGMQSLGEVAVVLPAGSPRPGRYLLAAGAAFALAGSLGVALLRRDRIAAGLAVWSFVLVAFGIYWAPEDVQFWLLVLPPVLILLARVVPAWAIGAAVVPIALWNLAAGGLPRREASAGLLAARCVADRLGPNDLVVAPGWDWAGDYLTYYSRRDVLSLNDTWVLSAKGDRAAFFSEVDRRIAATRSAGGRVYLVRLDSFTADEAAFFQRVTGLTSADFSWRRGEAFRCGAEPVSEILA